jgi:hypothetical protein
MLKRRFIFGISFVFVAVLLASGTPVTAQDKNDVLKNLHFQRGAITIGDNLASISLTDKYRATIWMRNGGSVAPDDSH